VTSPDAISGPAGSPVRVGIDRLGIDDVVGVARRGRPIAPLAPDVIARLEATAGWVRQTVDEIVSGGASGRTPRAFYGINTGFGALAGRTALDSAYMIKVLGRNLIASHSVGVGPYCDISVVRAALLIRAQSLAQGY
jgi:histidine ammonia-lyase